MIDKQAIETMTQMLALISKYAKDAYTEVETEASRENRRRAWTVTKMLARLAENAGESDFYFLLSDNVNNTDAERKRCYEQQRLQDIGRAELFQRVDWVSDRLGDGAGYDILSYDATDQPRYIEVKTTNGARTSAFIISRNELDFSQETGDAFHLYRVFQFRAMPMLYMLRGDISTQLHLEPMDYRASFRRIVA